MVTTASPTPGDVVTVPPGPGPLQLRVRGTRHDGRLVELHARKCAVGGGPQATLRVSGPALRPVELLILRGARSTVAKSWSPEARLNGRRFDAAPLSPGDLLAIGPLELEVVACPPPAGLSESPFEPARFTEIISAAGALSAIAASAGRPRSGSDRQRSRRLLAALRTARQELASALSAADSAGVETARLHALLHAGQAEVDRLRTEAHCEGHRKATALTEHEESLAVARAELAAQRIELNVARKEIDRRDADLLHRETDAAGALANRKTELSAREESLGLARAELDRLQMEDAERREQTDAERRLLTQRQAELEERSEALDRHDEQARLRGQELERRVEEVERAAASNREFEERRQHFGDEQAAFEAQRLAWETQRAEQQARIAEEQQRLSEEAERLEHVRRAQEAERADWEQERRDLGDLPRPAIKLESDRGAPAAPELRASGARHDTAETPTDEDDAAFARLRALSFLEEGSQHHRSEPEAPSRSPSFDDRAAPAAPWAGDDEPDEQDIRTFSAVTAASAEEDGDQSIQEYMNRLLQRVRGDSPPPAASQAATPSRSPTTYRPAPAPVAAPAPKQTPANAAAPASPRRSLAPERSSDLLAMRELANLSAQTALDAYAHRRWATAAVGKVIVSMFALVACLTLMAALPGWSTLKIVSGGAALVIAVFWGLQAGVLAQQVRVARRRRNIRPGAAPQEQEQQRLPSAAAREGNADEPFVPSAATDEHSSEASSD